MAENKGEQSLISDNSADNDEGKSTLTTVDESEAEVEAIPSPKFQICQPVLARDKDGLLYDSVIRRSIWGVNHNSQATVGMVNTQEEMEQFLQEQTVPAWHYFVHYNKWKPNWDRWVSEHDLLDITPENQDLGQKIIQEHKELQKEFKNNKKRKIDGGAFLKAWKLRLEKFTGYPEKEKNSSVKLSKQSWEKDFKLRTKQLSLVNRKGAVSQQIVLSFGLKKILVEEWEIITQFDMVHQLPSSVTIRQSLDLYLESKGINRSDAPSSITRGGLPESGAQKTDDAPQNNDRTKEWLDMTDGIALFFEQALAFRLLYPSEHSQLVVLENSEEYRDMQKAEIYGCEFLLRLFCQLPSILDDTYDKEEDITKGILAKINDFLRFLQKDQSTLFAQSYRKKNESELSQEQKEAKREERKRKVFAM
jgi:mortality factor 4-like protein 1